MSTPEAIQRTERIERTIDVRGIATHLFEAGDPTAPPLLYLHGMLNGSIAGRTGLPAHVCEWLECFQSMTYASP